MNIKEYIKIQADSCTNENMKSVFISLKYKFYPIVFETPIQSNDNYNTQTIVKKTNSENFYKRKVRVHLVNGKASIGLIDSDGYDIKLPNNQKMIYQLNSNGNTYYTFDNHFYYKGDNSRIVYLITKQNYLDHRAEVYFMRDYCQIDLNEMKVE